MRQVAILDVQGHMAVHTGSKCGAAAGHNHGAHCCPQANMSARDIVPQAHQHYFALRSSGKAADEFCAGVINSPTHMIPSRRTCSNRGVRVANEKTAGN